MPSLHDIAIRFRPYLKFSKDQGTEPCTPCTWQWFGEHSKEGAGKYLDLMKSADVRTPTGDPDKVHITIRDDSHGGPGWTDIRSGAALYCHVSSIDRGNVVSSSPVTAHELVNLEYWMVFPHNHSAFENAAFGDPFSTIPAAVLSHTGDLVCVQLLYDAATDRIVRVGFPIHGGVLVAFDLVGATQVQTTIPGIDIDTKAAIDVPAVKYTMNDRTTYQKGDHHSPGDPDVYFAQDPTSREFSHLAVFLEWGTHEAWPNGSGSVTAAPKHRGDSYSFLPGICHVLEGSEDDPFIYFGGRFGNSNSPVSAIRHRSWLRAEPVPIVADSTRDDVCPYQDNGNLTWPPSSVAGEKLEIIAHIEGLDDRTFHQGMLAGTRGKKKRLEGFQITLSPAIAGLGIEYMAKPENSSEPPVWVAGGSFAGTRHQSRALEGFAIRLTGPSAQNYHVIYAGHVEGIGDTGLSRDGLFCGVHGKWLEGMWVVLRKR